jgi:hypothetical protein
MTGSDDEPVRDQCVAAGDLQVVDRLDALRRDRLYGVGLPPLHLDAWIGRKAWSITATSLH